MTCDVTLPETNLAAMRCFRRIPLWINSKGNQSVSNAWFYSERERSVGLGCPQGRRPSPHWRVVPPCHFTYSCKEPRPFAIYIHIYGKRERERGTLCSAGHFNMWNRFVAAISWQDTAQDTDLSLCNPKHSGTPLR